MGYAALKLEPQQRQAILNAIPAKYSETVCDHITLGLMEEKQARADYAYLPEQIKIIGIADDGNGLQTLVVKVDESLIRPYDGKIFHITHSFDPKRDAPAAFDVLSKPGEEKPSPYRAVASNGLLRNLFDEAGRKKQAARPEWTYTELNSPLSITAYPVYVEDKEIKPLLARDSAHGPRHKGPGGRSS